MTISYDPNRRLATLRDRGLDFDDAAEVFDNFTLDILDERFDYGEERILTIGRLRGRMVVVFWTRRDEARHVISMRKANAREQARFGKRLEEGR